MAVRVFAGVSPTTELCHTAGRCLYPMFRPATARQHLLATDSLLKPATTQVMDAGASFVPHTQPQPVLAVAAQWDSHVTQLGRCGTTPFKGPNWRRDGDENSHCSPPPTQIVKFSTRERSNSKTPPNRWASHKRQGPHLLVLVRSGWILRLDTAGTLNHILDTVH